LHIDEIFVIDLSQLGSHKNNIWAADFFGLATQKFVIRRLAFLPFRFCLRNSYSLSCTMVWISLLVFSTLEKTGLHKMGHGMALLYFLYFDSTWRYRTDGYRQVSSLALSSSNKTPIWGVGIVETKACYAWERMELRVWGFTQKEVLAHLGFPLVLLFCWMEFSFRSEGLYLMNGGRHRHIGFWAGGGFYQGTFLNLQDSCNTEQSYYCLLAGWKRSYDEIGR